jgi:hypothetical protein
MKNHVKKLALRKEVVRDLAVRQLANAVGGISGPRICHSLDDICGGPGTGGATCTSGAPNCGTGLVSQCLC